MAQRFILAAIAFLTILGLAQPALEAAPETESASFLYTVAQQYEPLAWMQGGERFPAGAGIFLYKGSEQKPFIPGFAATSDPNVSFDGTRVLFAGKQKSQDPWQIWEVGLSEGSPRRITASKEDCIHPLYLPEDRIVYARKIGGRFVIESLNISGGQPLALTYGPASYLPADVLRDGRILFESTDPFGAGATAEIYTVYSDGSGVESYRCDHGASRAGAKQVHPGDIVFTSNSKLMRFTSARAQQLPLSAPAGEYLGEVTETAGGEWLLPSRESVSQSYRIVRWAQGSSTLQPVVAAENANVIQPTLLAERPTPNRHPSGLHDWDGANLLCLNAYTSKLTFAAASIRTIRLYTRDEGGAPKLLGTASVESDGSFFVHVPSEQPLQVELLDASGKTLQRESGFFWMRRGEQRACVGCHAGPETAPENAVPMTLSKSTTPADMTARAASASGGTK